MAKKNRCIRMDETLWESLTIIGAKQGVSPGIMARQLLHQKVDEIDHMENHAERRRFKNVPKDLDGPEVGR